MEKLQFVLVAKEERISNTIDTGRLENDVLRMRMGLMAKDHEAEKNEIIKTKDKTIEELKTTNEELNIKMGDQSDKMHQINKDSVGKDKEIESLTKRADELSKQKIKLEMDLKQATEMYEQASVKHAQQDEKIKKLESELSEVKNELKVIRIAKEEQVSLFATYLKEVDEKQERREKRLHKMMQKQHADILCQIKSMHIRSKPPAVKESKLNLADVHNVQISFDSQNGRNDAAFHRRTASNNRKTCKPSKGNNNLPK